MRIKKLVVSVGLTQNLGNYESARSDFSVEVELDEGEDVAVAHEKLVKAAKRRLLEQAQSVAESATRYLDKKN